MDIEVIASGMSRHSRMKPRRGLVRDFPAGSDQLAVAKRIDVAVAKRLTATGGRLITIEGDPVHDLVDGVAAWHRLAIGARSARRRTRLRPFALMDRCTLPSPFMCE